MRIAILGASQDRTRMSNKAVRVYQELAHDVFPVNPKYTEVEGLKCYPKLTDLEDIDRLSVYVNPKIGLSLVKDIVALNPKEIVLNPGSESDELFSRLKSEGLKVLKMCSILMMGKDPNNY